MYLKSIEVQGFKSFANKIVFDFHNGITGIVGPNGSGKSNVADAVRWVLGEQSVRQLRGASMQDVIFAGTENRKPLSFAYVAITLDNSDHQLSTDFEEVTVARRLYRSGESEYLLNGSVCRLKEVSELFYDTGIGKEGYSIIGQGQIDKVLSGKPEERRELFDEAAGIVKFKKRKLSALKKLEDERENLVRVNDILSELERQVEPLSTQAEKARAYLKKKNEQKDCDINIFLLESERISREQREAEENYKIADAQLRETNESYEKIKQDYAKLSEEMEGMDTKINAIREQQGEGEVLRGKLESQIGILNEQIHTAEMSDEHTKNRLEAIDAECAQREQERKELKEKERDQDEKLLHAKIQDDEAKRALAAVQEEIARCNAGIEERQKELVQLLGSRADIQSRQQHFDTMLEQINIRKAELGKRLLDRKTQEEGIDAELSECEKKLASINAEVEKLKEREHELAESELKWHRKEEENGKLLEEAQTAYLRQHSRLESLKNIAERYDGYGNSIRRVMEQRADNPGILGVVSDLIQVDKKYETAIETALGGNIQNIVTEDEQTAKDMIAYLKENRLGRATFLPLTSVRGSDNAKTRDALSDAGALGITSELVKYEKKYDGIASYLLGR
ncbi:MAG: chromosome segregation protein SMC, partial [Clostridiales bacterium]|nr:chromosome segregation protein SMC [Clostridiales bacterium]